MVCIGDAIDASSLTLRRRMTEEKGASRRMGPTSARLPGKPMAALAANWGRSAITAGHFWATKDGTPGRI